jgi:branched-subunit amino acid ABC-type transport system permease component
MLYREAGQFKTSYDADQAMFPIIQDRWFVAALIAVAYLVVPFVASEYWLQAVLIPFLVFSMAAIGLNLLLGYAGQLSLGTGAFMAVGAYATYKLATAFPDLNIVVVFVLAGVVTAGVGLIFGTPSLRIKGFYLAVATLAAQFFLSWMFNKVPWFYNYNPSGTITMPPRTVFGVMVTGPAATAEARYIMALILVTLLALAAKNIVRSHIGRSWMAIRDMDIAAEIIGFRPMQTKLTAFAVSSFYRGLRHQRLLPGAVHGNHRRAGKHVRLFPGCGVHHPGAGVSHQRTAVIRYLHGDGSPEASGDHDLRQLDRLLPDRRAPRVRETVADREGEAEGLAVPVLEMPGLARRLCRHPGPC